jgi:hypothetical protein
MVHHHQKAASCSAIPSFQSFSSVSTSSTQTPSLFENEYKQSNLKRNISPLMTKSNSQQSNNSEIDNLELFPLPSFCLYSKKALSNEYAPESDIIQFLSPKSITLEKRLPMFVGVLQSLFTVVNDMPFLEDSEDEDNDNEEEEEITIKESPFTIIGLNSMKLVVWNTDLYEKDLCLVIILSAQMTDEIILQNMNLLKDNMTTTNTIVSFFFSFISLSFFN